MIIRGICLEDAPLFYELIKKNQDHIKDFFPKTLEASSNLISVEELINDYSEKSIKNEMYVFVSEEEIKKSILGIFFVKEIVQQHSKCEIAYLVDKNEQGKGIATQGVSYLISFVFENLQLNKICCRISTDNLSSNRVALKNNFQLEGILKKEFKISSGKFININCYGLLRKEKKLDCRLQISDFLILL